VAEEKVAPIQLLWGNTLVVLHKSFQVRTTWDGGGSSSNGHNAHAQSGTRGSCERDGAKGITSSDGSGGPLSSWMLSDFDALIPRVCERGLLCKSWLSEGSSWSRTYTVANARCRGSCKESWRAYAPRYVGRRSGISTSTTTYVATCLPPNCTVSQRPYHGFWVTEKSRDKT
jgi:hypothetical protein